MASTSKWLIGLMAAFLLVGCQNNPTTSESGTVGALIGAASGGLIGSAIGSGTGQAVAIGSGIVLGGLLGHKVGSDMGAREKQKMHGSFEKATRCEIGETQYWDDKMSGASGSIRPIRDGMYEGLYCREFQTTIYIDGRVERMYGTACRTRDGKWVPVH